MIDLTTRLSGLSDAKLHALLRLAADQNAESRVLELIGSNIKVLRQGSPRLFLFPATEGVVSYLNGYLPHIPSAWGVYGCQTPGLDGEQAPYVTVEEVAAHSVAQIRRIQPHGPYRLAGICMGSLPAFEAARQLEADGERTAVLVHLVPTLARPGQEFADTESAQVQALHDYGLIIERLLGRRVEPPLAEIAAAPEERRTDILARFLANQAELDTVDPAVLRRRIEVYQANLAAMFSYRPTRGFGGRLHVLHVGRIDRGEHIVGLDSCWWSGAEHSAALRAMEPSQVEIAQVDTKTSTLFDCAEPEMSVVGAALRAVLERAGR